jgi:hypothetical protein
LPKLRPELILLLGMTPLEQLLRFISSLRDVFLDAITREVVQTVNGKGEPSS